MKAKITILLIIFFSCDVFSENKTNIQDYCQAIQRSYPYHQANCIDLSPEKKNEVQYGNIDSMMKNPDLTGVFYSNYWDFSKRNDSGRVRLYKLLMLVYGDSPKQISKNLIKVNFIGKNILFNSKNHASESLSRVSEELKLLITKQPQLKKYLKNADTYYFRKIAQTHLLSAHSFGIAIDLNPKLSQYWVNDSKNWQKKLVSYPLEIVEVFEKHGFIWGGRWEHYDTMHFEYRPEFLALKKIEEMK